MKKFLILVLMCVSATLMAAEKDTVFIYANRYHPPYELKDANGNPTGLTLELMKESMQRLHLNYKIIMCNRDFMLKNIFAHKYTVIAGAELTEDEIKQYKLSIGITYRYLFRSVLMKSDSPKKYTSFEELKGWRIAIEKGDISTDILKKKGAGCKLFIYNDIHDAVQSTLNGITDATYTDDAQAYQITKKEGLEDELSQSDMGLPPLRYSMFGNDSVMLRKIGLQFMQLKSDGTYAQIESKWLKQEDARVYVRIIMYILIVALIMVLFIILLRTQVNKAKRLIGIKNNHLKLAMDNAGIVTWHYNPDKQIFEIFTNVNKKACIYSREEVMFYINEKDRASVKGYLDKMDKKQIDVVSNIFELQDPIRNIPFRHYKVTCNAVKNSEGRILSYTGVSQDIEDLIIIQQHLEQEKQHAVNADRLKSVFLANMSHEIRTPLNAIVGFSQLLQDTEDKEQRKKFINIINTNNDQLLHIISDIIDMSKIETNTSDVTMQEFDFCLMMEDIIKMATTTHDDSNVKVIMHHHDCSCILYNDKNKIKTAVANIIDNAYKFTKEGSIDISMRRDDKYIYLMISDTGIGIAEADQKRIFDSFVKINSFSIGIGLGLTISKADVDMLGGDISVKSQVGKGSTFTISIPLKNKK